MTDDEFNNRPEDRAPAAPDQDLRWSPEPDITSPQEAESWPPAAVPPPPVYPWPAYFQPGYSQPVQQAWPQPDPAFSLPRRPFRCSNGILLRSGRQRRPRPYRQPRTRASAGSFP